MTMRPSQDGQLRLDAVVYPRAAAVSLATQRAVLVTALVMADAAALTLAFRFAFWLRFELGVTLAPDVVPTPDFYPLLTAVLVPLWLAMFALFGLYDPLAKLGGSVESSRTLHACTMAAMLVVVGTFAFPALVLSRGWLVYAWALSFLWVAAARFGARRVVYAFRRRGFLLTPALIVGTNQEAANLHEFLSDWQASGVRTLGFVSVEGKEPRQSLPLPVLGTTKEIRRIAEEQGAEDIIVAITGIRRESLLRLYDDLQPLPVHLRLSSGLYELLTTRVAVNTMGAVPLLSLEKNRLHTGEALVKRTVETVLVLGALALVWPLLLVIAAWIKIDSSGPVLYRRRVLGEQGRPFDAFKFRTMHVDGDALLRSQPGAEEQLRTHHKLKVDPRITRVGQWLRKYSLDEIPQFFNVLMGQMSLVGPRMITAEEAKKYGRHRMSLLSVKPGITGLWQVSGRSDLTYDERIRIDLYYVRNYSVWRDLQILFVQTLPAVLRGRGAY